MILQVITIVISRGNVYMLGEAYAFGVVWSFAMEALSVMVLRFKLPGKREWKVPLNIRIGGVEIPIGLGLITLTLFSLAIINVVTKKTATISGVTFTLAFFLIFTFSERYNRRHAGQHAAELERFRLSLSDDFSPETLHVRPGNIIVAVRNPNRLQHLTRVLHKTDTRRSDIVVLAVRQLTSGGSGEYNLDSDQIFTSNEVELFSKVVTLAEKAGKHVDLLAVPGILQGHQPSTII